MIYWRWEFSTVSHTHWIIQSLFWFVFISNIYVWLQLHGTKKDINKTHWPMRTMNKKSRFVSCQDITLLVHFVKKWGNWNFWYLLIHWCWHHAWTNQFEFPLPEQALLDFYNKFSFKFWSKNIIGDSLKFKILCKNW